MLIKLAIVAATFVGLCATLSTKNGNATIAIVTILLLVAVAVLLVGNSTLSATKHLRGEFWIAGCGEEFLTALQSGAFREPIADPFRPGGTVTSSIPPQTPMLLLPPTSSLAPSL